DGLELLGDGAADALGGRVGRLQLRVGLFEAAKLAHQGIVFAVRDLGIVEGMVPIVVVVDLLAQLFDAPLDGAQVDGVSIVVHGCYLSVPRGCLRARLIVDHPSAPGSEYLPPPDPLPRTRERESLGDTVEPSLTVPNGAWSLLRILRRTPVRAGGPQLSIPSQ